MKNVFQILIALFFTIQFTACKKTESQSKCMLQKTSVSTGAYMEYMYDSDNRPVKININEVDSAGNSSFEIMTIQYNTSGLATGFFCNMVSGILLDQMEWIYDSQNHLQTIYEKDAAGNVTETYKVSTDAQGRVIKTENVAEAYSDEYAYDNYGNFIYDRMNNAAGFYCNMTPEYDTKSSPFQFASLKGLPVSPIDYKPYTANNITRRKYEDLLSGQLVLYKDIKTSYTYNGDGFPVTSSETNVTANTAAVNTNNNYTGCQ